MTMTQDDEVEVKFAVGEHYQAKLMYLTESADFRKQEEIIRNLFGFAGYEIRPAGNKSIVDDYFDTSDYALLYTRASLRVRRKGGRPELTFKKLLGATLGEMRRTENTLRFEEHEFENLLNANFAPVLGETVEDLVGPLVKRLTVENERTSFNLVRADAKFELSFDGFRYVDPDAQRVSSPQFEIEIEAMNDSAVSSLGGLRRDLMKVLGTENFRYANGSKYERGIAWLTFEGTQVSRIRRTALEWRAWHRELTRVERVGVWGAAASILGFVIAMVAFL
jgi:inorganic triphosphatase YgiF